MTHSIIFAQRLAAKLTRGQNFLLILLILGLSSCQKDALLDVPLAQQEKAANAASVSRSGDLEDKAIEHAQWIINNVIPLSEDPAAMEALAAGNVGSPALQARVVALGYADFSSMAQSYFSIYQSAQSAFSANPVAGTSFEEYSSARLAGQIWAGLATPDVLAQTPCSNELKHAYQLAMSQLAVDAAFGDLDHALANFAHAIIAARIAFRDCLRQKYP
jgi:hypothetical protein